MVFKNFSTQGGGVLFGRNLFCGKFDETSFCAGPGLISFFVSEIEPFKDFSLLKFRHLAKFRLSAQTRCAVTSERKQISTNGLQILNQEGRIMFVCQFEPNRREKEGRVILTQNENLSKKS